MKYRFIEDPGHGWLEVKRAEIERLGIAPKISRYSYSHGEMAYLEEDCDMGRFVEAKHEAGEPVEWVRVYQENTPIRNYDNWEVQP